MKHFWTHSSNCSLIGLLSLLCLLGCLASLLEAGTLQAGVHALHTQLRIGRGVLQIHGTDSICVLNY